MMFGSYQNRWWIVVACTSGLVVVAGTINTFAIAVFLGPITQDLGVSRSVVSSGILVANVLGGLVTPLVGCLADRWGSRSILLPGIPLFALSIAAFALLQDSLISIYSLFAFAGLFGAMQNTAPYTKVISMWFDEQRGVALGTALSGIGFGIAMVPQMAHALIGVTGWRLAYIGIGGIIMLFAFVPVFLFVREPPIGELTHTTSGSSGANLTGLTTVDVLTGQWRFWAMTIAFFLAVIATNGTLVHLVAMLTDRGLSPEYATAILSSAGGGVIMGRIACGSCLDRLYGPCVAVCFFMVPALGIACLATELPGGVPLLGGALLGVGLGANIAIMAYFTSRYFGLRAYGKVFGVMFGVFLMGTGVGPYLNALSYDLLHSYQPAMAASSICLIASCLLVAPLGRYPFAPGKLLPPNPSTVSEAYPKDKGLQRKR